MKYNFTLTTISLIFFIQMINGTSSISITALDQSDWRVYRDLRLQSVLECPHAFGSTYEEELAITPEGWKRRLNLNMLFAQEDGTTVGMIGAVIDDREKTKHTALIISFYVDTSARNKGIGSLLLSHMLEKLQDDPTIQKIALHVTTTQSNVVQLYKNFGFHITGILENEYYVDGNYYDQYIMTKWCNPLSCNYLTRKNNTFYNNEQV